MIRMTFPLMAAVLTAAVSLPGALMAADYYKWVDSEGGTHYGAKPPDGVEASVVRINEEPPSDQEDELARRQARMENAAGQEKLAEAKDKGLAPPGVSLDDFKNNCAQYQRNLDAMEKSVRVSVKNPDGTSRALSDEERLRELEIARAELARCKALGVSAGTPSPAGKPE